MKCPRCGWEKLGKCQNPDCKSGNKAKRPKFKPPLKAQRGHGASARVRTYLKPGEMTIEDRAAQGGADYDRYLIDVYEGLSPEEKAAYDAQLEVLRQKFGRPPQKRPFENRGTP